MQTKEVVTMTMTLRDGFRGVLVGGHAGDALGAPYEGWSAQKIVEDFEKRGGLVPHDYQNPWFGKTEDILEYPMGRPTDDSDHTAALAQSLLACNGLDEEDLFYRLRDIVINHKSPLWHGKAVSGGGTTRTMLVPKTFEESLALPSVGAVPSNGSLMRSAPMALYFTATRFPNDMKPYLVLRMSSVTHRHPVARECCIAYIAVLENILSGQHTLSEAVERIRYFDLPWHDDVAEVLDNPLVTPPEHRLWPFAGDAVHTLHVALWALLTATSFRDGITKAVSVGGDTDTYAAVVGGLLGAYYGEQGIPPEWRSVLLGRKVMEHLADEFSVLANERA